MTAAILAVDEEAAREAAFNLGLREWIYPLHASHMSGVVVDLVVYVEGWRSSTIQPAQAGLAVAIRAAVNDAEELEQPRTATFLTGQLRARNAQLVLAVARRGPEAPFVSPESVQALVALRPRRRSWWARLWSKKR